MLVFNRGNWEEWDCIYQENWDGDFSDEMNRIGFGSETRIGKDFEINLTYRSRYNSEKKTLEFILDFNNSDFTEDIFVPDTASFIMALKYFKEIIGIDEVKEKSFKTFGTSDVDDLESKLGKDFSNAKKIHVTSTTGENTDWHYVVGEF